MNLRFSFFSGLALLVSLTGASAATHPPATPPGPVKTPAATNAPPVTSAPPQATAKSAKGAASPNGTNGTTIEGTPITKAPDTGEPTAAGKPAAPARAPMAPPTVLDKYLKDLNDDLKLTPDEQKEIETYYVADGAQLQKILNDASISPLKQDEQVSDLRHARDTKIEALLEDVDRQHEFLQVEGRYQVALMESAANGELKPAPTPAPAPVPTTAAAKPGAQPAPQGQAAAQ